MSENNFVWTEPCQSDVVHQIIAWSNHRHLGWVPERKFQKLWNSQNRKWIIDGPKFGLDESNWSKGNEQHSPNQSYVHEKTFIWRWGNSNSPKLFILKPHTNSLRRYIVHSLTHCRHCQRLQGIFSLFVCHSLNDEWCRVYIARVGLKGNFLSVVVEWLAGWKRVRACPALIAGVVFTNLCSVPYWFCLVWCGFTVLVLVLAATKR